MFYDMYDRSGEPYYCTFITPVLWDMAKIVLKLIMMVFLKKKKNPNKTTHNFVYRKSNRTVIIPTCLQYYWLFRRDLTISSDGGYLVIFTLQCTVHHLPPVGGGAGVLKSLSPSSTRCTSMISSHFELSTANRRALITRAKSCFYIVVYIFFEPERFVQYTGQILYYRLK